MADILTGTPQVMKFGSDTVTAPTAPAVGPTNLSNSAYTVSSFVPPDVSAPVSGSQIVNGNPLSFPSATPPDNGSSLVAGITAGQTQPPTNSTTPNLDKATTDYNNASTAYTTAENALPNQADLLKTAETATGADTALANLQELNTQIAEKTAAYNTAYQNAETKGVTSGTPAVFYQGEQAAIQRQKAVELGALGTLQAAATGNYNLAEQRAKDTANLQFSDAQKKIDNALNFLKLNESILTTAQKNQITTQTKADQAALTQAKTDRTNVLSSGAQTPFFKYPGSDQVYSTTTGQTLTHDQYIAQGGDPTYQNISTITKNSKGKWVVQSVGQATFTPGSPQDTSQKTGGLTSKQITTVKKIIAANPGEYGHAADQIDKELGAGTATKADNLLKSAYLIPSDAQQVQKLWNTLPADQQTLQQWNEGLTAFQQTHNFDTTTATKYYKQLVPKPKY